MRGGWKETEKDTHIDVIWEELKKLVKKSMIRSERKIRRKKLDYRDW